MTDLTALAATSRLQQSAVDYGTVSRQIAGLGIVP
jgi:hypothetical protein